MITDPEVAVAQVLRMVQEGRVWATGGTEVPVRADTICIHGDGAHAVTFARRLKAALKQAGVRCASFSAAPGTTS